MVTMSVYKNDVYSNLEKALQKKNALSTFFNTKAYDLYKLLQRQRWMTENSSEGATWTNSEKYAAWKLRRYGGGTRYQWIGGRGQGRPWRPAGNWPTYPGGGTKKLVATSRLKNSVIGDNPSFSVSELDRLTKKNGKTDRRLKVKEHRKFANNNGLTVYTETPYAGDVADRFHFMNFSPQSWSRFYAELRDFLTSSMKKGL